MCIGEESIFKKPLNDAPPRLQRMLLKLTKYDLDVRYVPGKQQVISDCLSRAPLSDTEPVSQPEDVIGVYLVDELAFESSTLKRFKDTFKFANLLLTKQMVIVFYICL